MSEISDDWIDKSKWPQHKFKVLALKQVTLQTLLVALEDIRGNHSLSLGAHYKITIRNDNQPLLHRNIKQILSRL